MMDVLSVTLNGVDFTSTQILESPLIKSLIEDGMLTGNTIELKHGEYPVKQLMILSLYISEDIQELPATFPVEMTFDIFNYFGLNTDKLQDIFYEHTHKMEPADSFRLAHKLKIIPKINCSLYTSDYYQLLEEGYAEHKILRYLSPCSLYPFKIEDEDFFKLMKEHQPILDIVDEFKDCMIIGGFLLHCLRSFICQNHEPLLNEEHYDIDIFCLNDSHNDVITKFHDTFDSRCFTNGAVTTIFIRNNPINIQIVAVSGSIEHLMGEIDFDCTNIVYRQKQIFITTEFARLMRYKWKLGCNMYNTENESIVARYRKYLTKGFLLDDREHAKIKTIPPITPTYIKLANKWYKWTDEDDERLLYIVQRLFSPGYQPTQLPIKNYIEWIDSYDPSTSAHSWIDSYQR